MLLHSFQEANVRWLLQQRARKGWILDETGLGKSVTAIEYCKRSGCQTVLVVTPGLVRIPWKQRFQEWWPEAEVGLIGIGRSRKNLSGPAKLRLETAYSAPIQVVSPDLMSEVRGEGWETIIVDEMHEYVSFRSQSSQGLRKLFSMNPEAFKLGLTATPLSAEPKHTWNLLQMFWPALWGEASKSGDPPFWFQRKFCNAIESEYAHSGYTFRGLRDSAAGEFAKYLGAVSRRTLRSDVAHLLPPIDLQPLVLPASRKSYADEKAIFDWLDTAAKESSHVAIFTYFRETAARLAEQVSQLPRFGDRALLKLDGSTSSSHRSAILQRVRTERGAILIGTMDSLGTGISLTDFKQYLIAEPPSTINKLVQAIGRFSRLDSTVPARGWVLFREGLDDSKIKKLKQRLGDMNSLIRQGQGEGALLGALDAVDMSGSFDRQLNLLLESYLGDLDASDD